MELIRKSYDKSIEAYFDMFRFLVTFNIITMLGFGYILIIHIISYDYSLGDLCDSYFP